MNTTTYETAPPVAANTSAPPASVPQTRRWQRLRQSELLALSAWLGFHVLLGVASSNLTAVGQIHSLVALAVGLWWAVSGGKLERVAFVGAYLIGAEVSWRMTQSSLFYEFGKYALVVILLVAILRNGLFRGTPLALVYFLFLLPSIVLPSAYTDDTQLRKVVSFNLSGPLALCLGVWMFSQITLKQEHLPRLLLALLAPTVCVATIAAYRLFTTEGIYFGKSSNKLASGGYGPNQVSATLGLGILAALLFVLIEKRERLLKGLLAVVMIGLGAQAALTFSRTGLYLAAVSIVVALLSLMQDRKARLQLVIVATTLFAIGNFLILPQLDKYTNGALSARFQSTDATSRDVLFMADLRLWADNPIFGVGPGLGADKRTDVTDNAASHTEYSRVLAEHGLFGLFALFALAGICWQNIRQARTPQQRAVVFGFLCWALVFMMVSAMRLAAPAFLVGLTSLRWMATPRWQAASGNHRAMGA